MSTLFDLNYSIRRSQVDLFLAKSMSYIRPQMNVIDLGGKRENKRGYFDLDEHVDTVKYLNIDKETNPDILSSIYEVPVRDKEFDAFVLTEVIEHLPNPMTAIRESHRILKDEGIGIITVPFMFHIHGDPYDYNRPTSAWLVENLEEAGFVVLSLEKQGTFWAVLFNEFRFFLRYRWQNCNTGFGKWTYKFINIALVRLFVKFDLENRVYNDSVLDGHTTGFGIIVRKR